MTPRPSRLLVRIGAPASEPLSLAETKTYLRVDSSQEDDLISGLISAAADAAQQYLRKSLITQSWKLAFDGGISACVALPMGPVGAVTSVTLVAEDESTTPLAASVYHLHAAKNALVVEGFYSAHRVEIIYTAGYGVAADVPAALRYGMLSHVAAMYEGRGEGSAVPVATQALYAPYREVGL